MEEARALASHVTFGEGIPKLVLAVARKRLAVSARAPDTSSLTVKALSRPSMMARASSVNMRKLKASSSGGLRGMAGMRSSAMERKTSLASSMHWKKVSWEHRVSSVRRFQSCGVPWSEQESMRHEVAMSREMISSSSKSSRTLFLSARLADPKRCHGAGMASRISRMVKVRFCLERASRVAVLMRPILLAGSSKRDMDGRAGSGVADGWF